MTPRMTRTFVACAAAASCVLGSDALAQVSFSEIRVDQPGLDLSEYVELRGPAGTSLAGLFVVVIGDDDFATPPSQNGRIESVVQLQGSIGASGVFLVAESTYQFGTPDQVAVLNFENPDNVTFLLVSAFTGVDGQLLDTNFDGTLDVTPWSALADSVALVSTQQPDGITSDFVYSTTRVGPSGATSPAHIWRCSDTNAWNVGVSDPADAADTAGEANPTCGGGGGGGGTLAFNEIRIKMPGNDVDEYVEFIGTPGSSLAGLTYIVLGDRAATATVPADYKGIVEMALPLDGAVVPSDGYLLIAEPTTTFTEADFITPPDGLNFEDNSTRRTHLVVRGWNGTVGADLDANDDCTVDGTPWTEVVCSVVMLGFYDTDCSYGTDLIPADVTLTGTYSAAHAYRCVPTGEWKVGAFDNLAGGDTPGAPNRSCAAGAVLECGEAGTGLCSVPHANPYCEDVNCCTAVCLVDPTCCTTGWDADCVSQAATSCAASTSSCEFVDARFNEIRIDMPGTDTLEFIEIAGTPGLSLNDLTVIIIGDGTAAQASGVVERVRPLTGVVIPSDGTLLIGNPATNPDVGNGAGTGGANLNNDWIENSDNITIMLVRGFSGTINSDLDTNDDGTFDSTPWIEVIDSIALIESPTVPPSGTEYAYGSNRIGPDGTFVPGHIWRCQDTGCWNIGLFDIAANQSAGNETPGANGQDCEESSCTGDLNSSGTVDASDLTILLANWGNSGAGDINNDGTVGGSDLTILLASWGACPP